jgi:hypothetical protein
LVLDLKTLGVILDEGELRAKAHTLLLEAVEQLALEDETRTRA